MGDFTGEKQPEPRRGASITGGNCHLLQGVVIVAELGEAILSVILAAMMLMMLMLPPRRTVLLGAERAHGHPTKSPSPSSLPEQQSSQETAGTQTESATSG